MTETQGLASLMDLLTTLIAFSVIMLVLSLIVTALVQGIQSGLSLRARNLRRGLVGLVDVVLQDSRAADTSPSLSRLAEEPERLAKEPERLAKSIVASNHLSPGKRRESPSKWTQYLPTKPGTSWVTRQELYYLLAWEIDAGSSEPLLSSRVAGLQGGDLPDDELGRSIDRWFDRFEASVSKTFLGWMRVVTFVSALAVAIFFQVDTFQTLAHLSSDAEARDRLVAAAEPLLAEAEEELAELGDPRAVLGEVLARLEQEYRQVEEEIESVSGESGDPAEVRADLRDALADDETTEAVVDRFDALVDQALVDRAERAEELRELALLRASRLDIAPWPRGLDFYMDGRWPDFRCLVGVLVTALLLSLGAPFWFNQLRILLNLRDQLSTLKERNGEVRVQSPPAS